MYAQLGDIQFEGLLGFTSLDHTLASKFAETPIIEGKPRLQYTGEELDDISFTMRLHASFCDPEFQFQKLNNKRTSQEVLPLLNGDGLFYGNFVIEQIKKGIAHTSPTGFIVDLELSVTLKEFYSPDINTDNRKKLQKDAFALGKSGSLRKTVKPITRGMSLMQALRRSVAAFQQITDAIKQIPSNPIKAAGLFASAVDNANRVEKGFKDMSEILAVDNNLNEIAPGLGDAVNKAIVTTGDLLGKLSSASYSESLSSATVLSGDIFNITKLSTPVVLNISKQGADVLVKP